MNKKWILLIGFCTLWSAFTATQKSFRIPPNWPEPAYDFTKNPLRESTISLGRVLFYDPILSKDSSISCASCHSPYNAFAHVDHKLSHGIADRIGKRNAPALMNLAWQRTFMWDGAINHLDMQALAPISHPDEMAEDINHVVAKLRQKPLYPKLFYQAFGDTAISGERLLKAIAQFMLTITSANSKYDSVMRHERQFSPQEEKGYALYKKHCAACHSEPLFTHLGFENNGLPMDTTLKDLGRYSISHKATDSLLFKVPTLRNIEFSYPYMHDGRFKSIAAVLQHYTGGINKSPTLSLHLRNPIVLSSNDKVDLTAFLLSLSDRSYIFNPQYSFPKDILWPTAKD